MSQVTFNGVIVAVVLVLDLVLLFALDLLIRVFGPVERLARASRLLGATTLDEPLGPGVPMNVIRKRLLFDLMLTTRRPPGSTIGHYSNFTVGEIMAILEADNVTVRRLVREIKLYAFMVAALFGAGLIMRLKTVKVIALKTVVDVIGNHPLDVLDSVALGALLFLSFRLLGELKHISELLES